MASRLIGILNKDSVLGVRHGASDPCQCSEQQALCWKMWNVFQMVQTVLDALGTIGMSSQQAGRNGPPELLSKRAGQDDLKHALHGSTISMYHDHKPGRLPTNAARIVPDRQAHVWSKQQPT